MKKYAKPIGMLLCIAVFCAIAFSLNNPGLQQFDLQVTRTLALHRVAWLTALMKGFTAFASPVVLLAVCLLLMYVFRRKHYSIPIAINLMVSVFLNFGLKNVFLRDRPLLIYRAAVETGYSFPSGHAMASAAFYGFLVCILLKSALPKRRKHAAAAVLTVLIALVGFSRVYLGVHYLTDVIAGFAVSTAYLIVFSTAVGAYLNAGGEAVDKPIDIGGNKRFADSFVHAFDGVAGGLKNERNMLLHFAAMTLVTVFGFLFSLSQTEWIACIILFGVVIGAELINTAIEATVDICMPHTDPRAKLAKDTAAGAVLAISVAAAIVGLVIFVPKLMPLLLNR